MDIQPKMQSIINTYYSNEAKELHKMVDKVLKNLHFTEVDTEDFYSLATDIFVYEVIFCFQRCVRNFRCTPQ